MNKLLLTFGICAMTILASQAAQAELRVRAGVGGSTYSLSGDYIEGKSKYNPVNFGLTYATDSGMYFDLAVSGGTGEHDAYTLLGAPAETFKRSDASLIVGKSMLNPDNGIAGTFYVGLKTGKTTLGAQNAGLTWTEDIFDTSGLVFGGGASFPIASGRAGAIGVNAGLGLMGAKWKDNAGFSEKAKTAIGFSFGLSYTYPINSFLGVVVDYKGNAYSYNFGKDTANAFTVKETVSALGATVYAKF